MAKKIQVICPECGTVSIMKYGFLTSKQTSCANCGAILDANKDSMKSVICEECGNTVLYDLKQKGKHFCPVCGADLEGEAKHGKYRELACPACGVVNMVDTKEPTCECPVCGISIDVRQVLSKETKEDGEYPYIVRGPERGKYAIWHHPLTKFPFGSQLIVQEGLSALFLRNGVCEKPLGPGNYTLSDDSTNLLQRMDNLAAGRTKNALITADIYFITNRLDPVISWNMKAPWVSDSEGKTEGTIYGKGSLTVKVTDSKQFADFIGYKTVPMDELLTDSGEIISSTEFEKMLFSGKPDEKEADSQEEKEPANMTPFHAEVRRIAGAGTLQVLRNLQRELNWRPDRIDMHRDELATAAKDTVSALLDSLGLSVDRYLVKELRFEEGKETSTARANAEQEEKNKKNIIRFAETGNNFVTDSLWVHMKEDRALSGNLKLNGSFKLYVKDAELFFERSEVRNWIENGTTADEVSEYTNTMVSNMMTNVLNDLLQPMIDETGADIRELSRYFSYFRESIQNYSNRYLARYGLEIEQLSMKEQSFEPSEALKAKGTFESTKTTRTIEEEMHAFITKQNLEHQRVNVDAAMESDDLNLKQEKHQHANGIERHTLYEESIQADTELRKVQIGAQTEIKAAEMKADDELSGLKHEHHMHDGERFAAEAWQDWTNKKDLYHDQLKVDLETRTIKEEWDIESRKRTNEAKRAEEVSVAQHDQMIRDIMRKIDESDLDYRKKLEDYERLSRNLRASDEAANMVAAAKAQADSQYMLANVDSRLSREERTFVESLNAEAEERAEKQKEADFRRKMEEEASKVEHEMERLKLEYEESRRHEELQAKLEEQRIEIEKLQATLSYYKDRDLRTAESDQVRARAEAEVRKAEAEIAAAAAEKAREEAQKREAREQEREDRFSEQAERMISRVWQIQGELAGMRIETDRAAVDGQTASNIARANAESSRVDALISELQNMIKAIRESQEKPDKGHGHTEDSGAEMPSIQIILPSASAQDAHSTADPVPGVLRICPKCGTNLGFASTCPKCGTYYAT